MTELRWTLLGIGALVVVGIYLWGRRGGSSADADAGATVRRAPDLGDHPTGVSNSDEAPFDASRLEPVFAKEPEAAVVESAPEQPSDQPEDVSEPEPEVEPEPVPADKVVVLHLVPAGDAEFDAQTVLNELRALGLRYGPFDVFHRYADEEGNPTAQTQPQFTVANMLKPGIFDLEKMRDSTLKGISMFLQMPGPEDPVTAFTDMVATGRRLAVALEGQLVDSQGCAVSRQRASHMREDIIAHRYSEQKSAMEEEARSEV